MTKEEAKLVLDNARPQIKEIDRQFYDDEDLNNALDMAIKALEQPTMDKAMIHTLMKENDELQAEIGRLRQELELQSSEEISKKLKKCVFYEIVEPKEMVAKELGCKTQWDCIKWLWTLDILQKHGFAICRTEEILDD